MGSLHNKLILKAIVTILIAFYKTKREHDKYSADLVGIISWGYPLGKISQLLFEANPKREE